MILLLGGTSETAPIASSLTKKGFLVLVSTATETPLDLGMDDRISRRSGPLTEEDLRRLIAERGDIEAVVDATHPYAGTITRLARAAAASAAIPFFRFSRPGMIEPDERVHLAKDHASAAKIAFSFGRPVLLTTGSRNLAPYADEARATGIPLIVRALASPESLEACEKAGIPPNRVITSRGPFTLEENLDVITKHQIGVLVTKDSGKAGGVAQKLEAARVTNCEVVVVARPDSDAECDTVWSDITELGVAISELLTNNRSVRENIGDRD
jgi:precorrin-6A/cobalt-precorrin-6A reductase